MTPDIIRYAELFAPDLLAGYKRALADGGRFVHYTSAEVALSIFESNYVWMRNAMTMNDFLEIEHGKECLFPAYQHNDSGKLLQGFLDRMFPGFTADFDNLFNSWLPHFESETYLTSLSEHPVIENEFGRLSMWRAYGGRNGVALVLRLTPFMADTDELKAYSAPVSYQGPAEFSVYFKRIVDNIIANHEEIRELGSEVVKNYLFTAFRSFLLCTKHRGFEEEREWRVIYSPTLGLSPAIVKDYASINGVPQIIYKIPLLNDPAQGLHGADLDSLLERVIIGPTREPYTIWKALVSKLTEKGVRDAGDRVFVSTIPLRT